MSVMTATASLGRVMASEGDALDRQLLIEFRRSRWRSSSSRRPSARRASVRESSVMAEPGTNTAPVGLVLAGGGARGAYEIGALSEVLPALPSQDRPRILVGTSVGALNCAYLAATADLPLAERLEKATRFWKGISW